MFLVEAAKMVVFWVFFDMFGQSVGGKIFYACRRKLGKSLLAPDRSKKVRTLNLFKFFEEPGGCLVPLFTLGRAPAARAAGAREEISEASSCELKWTR